MKSQRPRWHWILLGLALAWSVVLRIPLILNAATHLDSDLAVDGLTLLDAARGHLRWHYPGTPHIGSLPTSIGLPFGWLGGINPITLGLSGVFINAIVIVATFGLALRLYGSRAAAWSLLPLTFASTGVVWLSGRITGGHLLAVSWHAGAFALLYANLTRGGRWRAIGLGLWCGLGLWNDSMFVVTLAGLVPAGLFGWWTSGRSRSGLMSTLVFVVGMGVGIVPKIVGDRVDPSDAYRDQFAPIWRADVLLDHARILGLDCLPRLLVGHRLPGLEAEPGGIGPDGQALGASRGGGLLALITVATGGLLFVLAVAGLIAHQQEPAQRVVVTGLVISTLVTLAGFIVNRNIFNSDNYRYLGLILVPWSLGLGRGLDRLSRRGAGGMTCAGLIGLAFACLFTLDLAAWYRGLGWLDGLVHPVVRRLDDPILGWLDAHREVTRLYGGYWDVYRLSFLTGGRVEGVPSGHYPNRFPDSSERHPGYVLARGTPVGAEIRRRAIADGGRELFRAAGGVIVSWP